MMRVWGWGPVHAYGSSVTSRERAPFVRRRRSTRSRPTPTLPGSSRAVAPPPPPPATPPPAEPRRTGVSASSESGPSPNFHPPSPVPAAAGPLPLPYTIHKTIPKLDDLCYEYGNVRRYVTGVSAYMDPELAQAIPKGVRGQRAGLLYDSGVIGFEPTAGPHGLGGPPGGGGGTTKWSWRGGGMLHVTHDPEVGEGMVEVGERWGRSHVPCREGDCSNGGMVGVGEHLRRDGQVAPFILKGGEGGREQIHRDMESMGGLFREQFAGRGVGYEEMLERQGQLWRSRQQGDLSERPVCWDMSWDLGNAEHCDRDGWRSYARWFARHRHASASRAWWLLFPRHGVAVQLTHGTWVSWDGRTAPHCTAVPVVAEGDCLMSLFCSLPANVVNVLQRGEVCRAALCKRSSQGVEVSAGRALFDELREGMRVRYRFVPLAPPGKSKRALRDWGKAHVRWVSARVASKSATHVVLRDASGSGLSSTLSVGDVSNRVVIE